MTRHKQGKGKRSTTQTPNKRKLHDTSPIAFRLMLFLFFFLLNLLLIYSFYPLLWDWFKSNTSGEVRELQFHSPVAKTCWQLSRPTSEHGNRTNKHHDAKRGRERLSSWKLDESSETFRDQLDDDTHPDAETTALYFLTLQCVLREWENRLGICFAKQVSFLLFFSS